MSWKIILGAVLAVVAIVALLELFVVSVSLLLIGGIVFVAAVVVALTLKLKQRSNGHATGAEPTEHAHRQ